MRAGIPWVGGGYNGPLVTVGVFTPQGPCFQCVAAGEEALLAGGPPPRLGGAGVIAPSAGISGHLLAYEVIGLLTGVSRTAPGFVRGINLLAPDDTVLVRHPARPDCPTCNP
jgi:molybdopterin/thiamine biosynthesis adenylyltransferase